MDKNKWMSLLDENTPLREINVPGSHDAGTSDIHICSPWNSARKDSSATFAKIARYTTPCTNVNYSKTQNLDLTDQFKHGVRYFDLRVAKHYVGEQIEYRFTHGLLGGKFLDGMRDLIIYSKNFPSEILICDIRFIWGFNEDDHKIFQSYLLNLIDNRLAKYQDFKASTKLKDYWFAEKNIIVIYHHTMNKNPAFWPKSTVASLWPNTTNSSVAVDKMDKFISELHSTNRWDNNPNTFYGLHATLTPDTFYVATHLWSSVIKLANQLNNKLVPLMKGKWKDSKLSFVMFDVVEYPQLADAIILSNF
jgi:hypothetical protein